MHAGDATRRRRGALSRSCSPVAGLRHVHPRDEPVAERVRVMDGAVGEDRAVLCADELVDLDVDPGRPGAS